MLQFFSKLFNNGSRKSASKNLHRVRPTLEGLEERALMSTVTALGGLKMVVDSYDNGYLGQYAYGGDFGLQDNRATNIKLVGTAKDDTVRVFKSGTYGNDVSITVQTGTAAARTYSLFKDFGVDSVSDSLRVQFYGNNGKDTFVNDTFFQTSAYGGEGKDDLQGGFGINYLYGEGDNDVLTVKRNNVNENFLDGGAGYDTIRGGDGRDTIYGGSENDFIWGYGGKDFLLGDEGDDIIRGGSGNDTILGGADNDTLFGEAGADKLYGEDGIDALDGGLDNDQDFLEGGSEADRFSYYSGWKPDYYSDLNYASGDTLDIVYPAFSATVKTIDATTPVIASPTKRASQTGAVVATFSTTPPMLAAPTEGTSQDAAVVSAFSTVTETIDAPVTDARSKQASQYGDLVAESSTPMTAAPTEGTNQDAAVVSAFSTVTETIAAPVTAARTKRTSQYGALVSAFSTP